MTVCLAALFAGDEQNSPAAVVAADRMVTMGGFIEFEHAVPKMAQPSPYATVMIAGETLTGTRLARDVADALNGSNPRIAQIAQALAQQYQAVRRAQVEQQILAPRGLDFGSFYANHASLNHQVTMMVDQAMSQWNLGVELLLAGVDFGGAHIFSIHNPGGSELQHDVIGYAAIGSGAIHAVQSMIGFSHHAGATSLEETVFRAYASKRRAEVAPGVGHDTDMAIISVAGIDWLSPDQIDTLERLYEDYTSSTAVMLSEQLKGLKLTTDRPEGEPT